MVGLGNPGGKYETTRHNIGFLALDHLTRRHGLTFAESKWQALCSKAVLWGKPVLLIKPLTYMNASGRAVAPIASFFKVPPEKIIVVHDELDLPLGRVKIVIARGAGGHNGIRSLIAELGTAEFCRIRAGIGRPEPPLTVTSFVLAPFTPAEEPIIGQEMGVIAESIRLILEKGVAAAMNSINALP
ncbi:MAG: aminoacyl-tRNA hydrolase [Desulfobacteraceae bacterium]|nr:aminoacyl-tRNA hydrolase [Desulfobacteraceae bacterium]